MEIRKCLPVNLLSLLVRVLVAVIFTTTKEATVSPPACIFTFFLSLIISTDKVLPLR